MTPSILDAIGNTPLVEIKKLNPNPKVRILAKLEYMNPGGSIKDRAALSIISDAEKSGALTKDRIVIEATSGNTGIGLAMVCAVKGYRLLLAMSELASVERQKILRARGADIVLTPGHLGTDGAIEEVYRLAREHPELYFMADQYNNPSNWKAHYNGTAAEIWEQTDGTVTTVVATMGTTGTLMGISRRMKEFNPDIDIVGVEPYLGHKIQGLKNMKESYQPEMYEKNRLDSKVNVEDEPAFEMTRRLAREEGLFVGMSSGAAMVAAVEQARQMTGGTIVVIFPDGGERYLSTPLFTVQDNVTLSLFNTVNRKKEFFKPARPGKVSVYSCGPTAYDRMHLGVCRRFVFSDLLCRYLEYRNFDVTHIVNITDLDDKTIQGSEESNMELPEFTERYIRLFRQDLDLLGVKPASAYPRVSEHLDDMVSLSRKLVTKGFAYESLRSLYFDISKQADYGKFSGIDLNKIRVGATVDLDEYEKDNPRDFTLLKRARLSELKRGIFVKTDWGNVRPSLHLQCAAISMKYLGESFDIHTSGRELIFPHHENEMAIAKAATGKPLARYWLHCDRVVSEGRVVDKKGTRLTLADLVEKGFSGREIRYWLISSQYRKPAVYSEERLKSSRRGLKKIDACIYRLANIKGGTSTGETDQLVYDLKNGFTEAMDDDLNISKALAAVFKTVKKINILLDNDRITPEEGADLNEAFRRIDSVLKICDFSEASGDRPRDENVKALVDKRNRARLENNWELADQIRDELIQMGVTVHDDKIS